MKLPKHKTKIIGTIGPACESPEIMEQMIRAGMDVARVYRKEKGVVPCNSE